MLKSQSKNKISEAHHKKNIELMKTMRRNKKIEMKENMQSIKFNQTTSSIKKGKGSNQKKQKTMRSKSSSPRSVEKKKKIKFKETKTD